MFQSIRFPIANKATLGLVVTLFVASACSHKDIVQDDLSEVDGVETSAPAPVFASEPDATPYDQVSGSTSESTLPAPTKTKKASKSKISKSSKKSKKHTRRNKKNKKIAKNRTNKAESQAGAAMGMISDQLPPPPAPPAPEVPSFENSDMQMSPVVTADSTGSSYQWLYIITALAIGMIAFVVHYRKTHTKKSRRLVFAKN